MYKKIIFSIIIFIFATTPLLNVKAETLSQRLSGRILLQVEQNGEAWFVSPSNQKRYFLGRPSDAFQVMRELGLGISNADFIRFENNMPDKLLGKIILKVEDAGKAFYIYPIDKKPYFLGRPSDAFRVMRELGLGITDLSLNEITEDDLSQAKRLEQEKNIEQIKNEENVNPGLEEKTETQEETATTTEENANNTATTTEEVNTSTEEIIASTGSASCEFLAEYFKKELISGAANYQETVQGIDFDWGTEAPEILGNFSDKFAIRYTGDCYFEEGTYEFSSTFNDGIEATLDSFWLAKSWKDRNTEASEIKTLNIEEGFHRVKIEYYDHLGDASLSLDWSKLE